MTLAGWRIVYSGKVRDLYIPETESRLELSPTVLMVATDRVSAFDHVLSPGIPGKGELLTTLSRWWFAELSDFPNHLLEIEPPIEVARRGMVVRSLNMLPVECVVRGYLVGSGWLEYKASGTVCGIALPAGLANGDRLPEPLFTPAFKAPLGDHDENISFAQMVDLVGDETAGELRDMSLAIFRHASAIAEARGLILADSKFEFGRNRETGALTLGDEVLTSDSSRFWDATAYAVGGPKRLDSFDKQIVRDWLAANWDTTGTPPELPAEIVTRTAERYRELISRLTTMN
ncbi:MAG: phosphoribosylaminoimidazolesuccinocarboxamide synthase [Microbacteriaceae bacterium]|nr:phosphoribosylaminoimidazolesuccinocarboxamide synthase [Microbacteriaceae bacterium]